MGAVIASPFILIQVRNFRARSLLGEQLQLARNEGIPTNATEYLAMIKAANDQENAAPIYQALRSHRPNSEHVRKAYLTLLSKGYSDDAQRVLGENAEALELIDKAVLRPRCWFDRPWERGAAVLLPELADMKFVAKLVSLRGAVAASRGDTRAALADANAIFVIAKHSGEEPHAISHMVRDVIYMIGLHALADWSFRFRNPEYITELKKRLAAFPEPDLRAEQAGELWNALSLIELMRTPQGRSEIGIKESDMPAIERAAPLIFNQGAARVNMVKHFREYWAALNDPKKNDAKLTQAMDDMERDMIAFPAAADVYSKLSSGGETGGSLSSYALDRINQHTARVQQYTAVVRALSEKVIPRKIRTDDLPSPFGGPPLEYRFDGKQIVIEGPGPDRKLTILGDP